MDWWDMGKISSFDVGLICSTVVVTAMVVSYQVGIDPYMDEIFHIPQALLVCSGDYVSWDSKITTFPGLYYITCFIHRVLASVQCAPALASPSTLRAINICLSLIILTSSLQYWKKIHHGQEPRNKSLIPALVYAYPLSSFYYGLFYTDTISTTMVLLYLAVSNMNYSTGANRQSLSFLDHLRIFCLASLAIFARQTNVLWVLFSVGVSCENIFYENNKNSSSTQNSFIRFVLFLFENFFPLIKSLWSSILPVIAFVIFVVLNGGIVVGDKENHKPTIHFAMFSHCFAILGILSIPSCIASIFGRPAIHRGTKRSISWTVCATLGIIGGLGMVYGSQSHPFLLSDNRHLSFYLWRWVFSTVSIRWALFPVYSFLICIFIGELSLRESPIWILVYILSVSLSLLPTPLLELRYFTVPVIVGLMHSRKERTEDSPSTASIREVLYIVLLAAFVVLNAAAVYIFLFRPFQWPDGSLARFMY